MAAPLFGKTWLERSKGHHAEVTDQFKAAVASARSGSDDAIKQVCVEDTRVIHQRLLSRTCVCGVLHVLSVNMSL
jgi:hypothetical protein